MNSYNRMDIAKKAMTIFIQSLPVGSNFSIISFGSKYSAFEINGTGSTTTCIPYNDSSKEKALQHISEMTANFGGTNIYDPLVHAQE